MFSRSLGRETSPIPPPSQHLPLDQAFQPREEKGVPAALRIIAKPEASPHGLCQAGRQSSWWGQLSPVSDPPSWVCRLSKGHAQLATWTARLHAWSLGSSGPGLASQPPAPPPSPGRPPSPEGPSPCPRGSPPPRRLPSANPGGLHPPASLLPSHPHSSSAPDSPRLAPPAPHSFPPSSGPPPAPSLCSSNPGLHLPLSPDPVHLSPPSFPISPSLLRLRPGVRLSPSQLLSGSGSCPSPAWGVDVGRPPRPLLRGELPHWAPAKAPGEGTRRRHPARRSLWAGQPQAAFVVRAGASEAAGELSLGTAALARRVERAVGSGPGWANPNPEAKWTQGVCTGGSGGPRAATIQGFGQDGPVAREAPAQASSHSVHLDERGWAPTVC